jgi:hypothetical protein
MMMDARMKVALFDIVVALVEERQSLCGYLP